MVSWQHFWQWEQRIDPLKVAHALTICEREVPLRKRGMKATWMHFGHLPERRLHAQELKTMRFRMLAYKFRLYPNKEEERKLLWTKEGSENWNNQRIIVARTYGRVENQSNNFQHEPSRHNVDSYDLIVTEKLDTKEMFEDGHLLRSISDAS
jgi:hypothetical protein